MVTKASDVNYLLTIIENYVMVNLIWICILFCARGMGFRAISLVAL